MGHLRIFLIGFMAIHTVVQAQEQALEGKIQWAGLFKNGLAVIEQEVVLKGAGEYSLNALPIREPMAPPVATVGPSNPTDPPKPTVSALVIILE